MNVYPFIEAEKVASRNVARAWALMEVSRSAYYQQRDQIPSARETSDTEMTEQIRDIHPAQDRRARERFALAVEARKRGIKAIKLNTGDDLEALVRAAAADGAQRTCCQRPRRAPGAG